ncbi:MAG: hypothetical protein IPO92_04695 [Saprospiraceae bacterium]|nr:hypothetical protein [Saprospiraceae bacterium]
MEIRDNSLLNSFSFSCSGIDDFIMNDFSTLEYFYLRGKHRPIVLDGYNLLKSVIIEPKFVVIKNLQNLESIHFLISEFSAFSIENLPNLRSIKHDGHNYKEAEALNFDYSFKDLPKLETLSLGSNCTGNRFQMTNLPLLSSFALGSYAKFKTFSINNVELGGLFINGLDCSDFSIVSCNNLHNITTTLYPSLFSNYTLDRLPQLQNCTIYSGRYNDLVINDC